MSSPSRKFTATAFFLLFTAASWASPVFTGTNHLVAPSFGRNIRQLPCLDKVTHQRGVCMFAWDCMKANGTHLGTCIDRFYFGSCCQLANSDDAEPVSTSSPHVKPQNELPTAPPSTTVSQPLTTPGLQYGPVFGSSELEQPSINGLDVAHLTTLPVGTTLASLAGVSSLAPVPTELTTGLPASTVPQKPELPSTTSLPSSSSLPTTHVPETTVGSTTTLGTTTPAVSSSELPTLPVVAVTPPVQHVDENPSISHTFSPPTSGTAPQGMPTTVQAPSELPEQPTSSVVPVGTGLPVTQSSTTAQVVSVTPPTGLTSQEETTVYTEIDTLAPEIVSSPELTTNSPSPAIPEVSQPSVDAFPAVESEVTTTVDTENPLDLEGIAATEFSTSVDAGTVGPDTEDSNGEMSTEPQVASEVPEVQSAPLSSTSTISSTTESSTSTSSTTTTEFSTTVSTTPSTTFSEVSSTSSATTLGDVSSTSSAVTLGEVSSTSSASTLGEVSSTSSATTVSEVSSPSSEATVSEVSSTSSVTSTESITTSPVTDTTLNNANSSTSIVFPTEPVTLAPGLPAFPDYKKVCGRPVLPRGRIVGGSTTQFGEWPWQISLRQWRSSTFLHKCGAALLNENWAITAAHCVENVQPEDLLLRLGEYDLASEDEAFPYVERKVQIVASHPQFDARTFEYDLALLRFYDPVPYQPNIVPICIPTEEESSENFVGRVATVTGWGRLYEDGPLPSKLQQVNVPVINNTDCEGMYRKAGYVEHIPSIFICAGYADGKKDSCEGDSGGPMVLHNKDRWVLGGVISWGIGCAETNQPGVYTRISEFRDWINQIIVF